TRVGGPGRHDATTGRIENEDLRIGVAARAEWYRVRIAVVADVVVGRNVAVPMRRERTGIQKTPPPLPGATARFVVAAHDDPRRRAEERHCGSEDVGLPRVPAVAP